MEILWIIFLIIGVVLAIKFVRFLFLNWLISRILSLVAAFISLILPLFGTNMWACIVLSAASWCFLIGPVIFDVDYDFTKWDVLDRDSDGYIKTIGPQKSGGFIGNAVGALAISAAIYIIFGEPYPMVYILLPLLLVLLNLWISRAFWMGFLAAVIKKKED